MGIDYKKKYLKYKNKYLEAQKGGSEDADKISQNTADIEILRKSLEDTIKNNDKFFDRLEDQIAALTSSSISKAQNIARLEGKIIKLEDGVKKMDDR